MIPKADKFTFQTEMGGQENDALLPLSGNFCDALFASTSANKKSSKSSLFLYVLQSQIFML